MYTTNVPSRPSLLVLLTVLALAPAAGAQTLQGADEIAPPSDGLCAIESERYRVDFIRAGRCCPNVLEFWVEGKDTGHHGRLAVETRIVRPGLMTLVEEDKVLVGGTLGRGARALVIVDLVAGALQDEIHSFDFRLSPSQRRIVYSRHFAPDTPEDERRPIVLLYDLAKDAAGNRSGSPATLDTANAGVPVYPEANAVQGSYDPRLEPPHRYLSTFLWSDDGRRVVFFEHFEGRYALVELTIPPRSPQGDDTVPLGALSEDTAPRIARRTIDSERLMGRDAAAGSGPAGSGHPVATLRWVDERTVALQALAGGFVRDEITVALR